MIKEEHSWLKQGCGISTWSGPPGSSLKLTVLLGGDRESQGLGLPACAAEEEGCLLQHTLTLSSGTYLPQQHCNTVALRCHPGRKGELCQEISIRR